MDMPLLVSLLSLSTGGAVRGSTAPVGWSGVSPYFAYCPSSSVPNRSSFGTSASGFRFKVFAMGSPFRVGSVSVLDWIEDSCSTFLVFASSLRDGVTLSGRGLFQISIETKTCLAHLPCGWCLAFVMGSPILSRVALFCALDRNEGCFPSSILSCFAMGPPGGSSVWFPALDRNEAVFG